MESAHDDLGTPLNDEFNALANSLLEEWHVPGMSIAVIDGDRTFAEGYGISSFPNIPVMPETTFFTASTTKSFTSAAISLLIDDDTMSHQSNTFRIKPEPLTWKTEVSSLIPDDFVLPDLYTTAHITIEDALCHRTGMPDHENSFPPRSTDVRGIVRSLRHLPMTSELREEFMYNNVMYSAISHVLETRTKASMGVFLKERIWDPLGMSRTFWTLLDALQAEKKGDAKLARGYAWDQSTGSYVPEDLPDFPAVSGSGAIISNVLDYAAWLKCMMTRSAPLSASGHVSLITPRVVAHNAGNNPFPGTHLYALGWYVDMYRGEQIIWHSGGWTGYGSIMAYLPGREWAVAMMGNTSRTSNYVQMVLLFRLLDTLLGTPKGERRDWNEKWRSVVRERRERSERARERLYPNLPPNVLQMALELGRYAGVYRHPGYGDMKLVLDGEGLVADRTEMEIAMNVKLEHVSGEFWLAYLLVKNRDKRDAEVVRAEFYVDVEGRASRFGVELESKMGSEKIWFARVDG